jgi:regulatory GntR family protein
MHAAIPEYMKVRTYLYKRIISTKDESFKIPPENELCRLFNVSRVTVRGAIKGLVDDNILIPRRGLGTFINYEKLKSNNLHKSFIGMLEGDGQYSASPVNPITAECIIQSGMNFETLYLPESNKPKTFLEPIKNTLHGIVWRNASSKIENNQKYIDAISGHGLPLLLIETDPKTAGSHDSILSSIFERGERIADYMFSKGHKKVLFIHNDKTAAHLKSGSTYSGFYQRMQKLAHESGNFEDRVIPISKLKERLEALRVDKYNFTALYTGNYLVPYVMKELQKSRLSVPEDISYLVFGNSNPYFFKGLKPDMVSETKVFQNTLIKWLDMRINEKNFSEPFMKKIDLETKPGETVKDLNPGGKDEK